MCGRNCIASLARSPKVACRAIWRPTRASFAATSASFPAISTPAAVQDLSWVLIEVRDAAPGLTYWSARSTIPALPIQPAKIRKVLRLFCRVDGDNRAMATIRELYSHRESYS